MAQDQPQQQPVQLLMRLRGEAGAALLQPLEDERLEREVGLRPGVLAGDRAGNGIVNTLSR
jgi:hypothetical protein